MVASVVVASAVVAKVEEDVAAVRMVEGGGGRGGGADGGRWRRTCCPTAPQLHAPQAVDSAVDARLWFLGAVDARHRGVAASGAAGGCARQGGRARACAQALPAQSYRHRNVAPIATEVRASAPATAAVVEFAAAATVVADAAVRTATAAARITPPSPPAWLW